MFRRSFRATAVRITLVGLPCASKRSRKARIVGLYRTAERAAVWNRRRMSARSP